MVKEKSMNSKNQSKIKLCAGDRVFYSVVNILMFLILLVVIIPILNVISSSLSDSKMVMQGKVFLLPKEFSLEGYKVVFANKSIVNGYLNTIFYTVVATALNIVVTLMCAYPLSRQDLVGRNYFMFFFTFTMLFSGGIIPTYLLMRDLHLIDNRLVMILPGALSVYNMIVARTFFQTNIPKELLEAAKVDGCQNIAFIIKIVIPLSKPIIAVLSLYYAVAHWNAYFSAFLYLNNPDKFPLQLVLREILIANSLSAEMLVSESERIQNDMSEVLKYSSIIVACLPIWLVYPMIQKYFVKGVMLGSIKG